MSSTADFKMIRPVTITDAMVTANNIPNSIAATYSAGTTYAAGDLVGLAPVYGEGQLVYRSLASGNIGHALPVPPATSTAYWSYVATVYPAYASGSTCAEGGVVTSGTMLYESLVAGNTGNALTDREKWLPLGSTNSWRAFDATYGSQAELQEEIVIVLSPGTLVNCMFLGNIDAATVTVEQSVSGFSETRSVMKRTVNSWYSFYYEGFTRVTDAVFVIPPYADSELTITISNPGQLAKCGIISVGKSIVLGTTQWGAEAGGLSFSGTTTDCFGNTTFLRRAVVKKLNISVYVLFEFADEVARLLNEYTDVPMVFIGSTELALTMIYGFLGSWSLQLEAGDTMASIEIKGLT